MTEFESRIQNLDETEEKYMLACKMGMKTSPSKRASPPSRARRLHINTASVNRLNGFHVVVEGGLGLMGHSARKKRAVPQQEPGWATQAHSKPSDIRCHYCN